MRRPVGVKSGQERKGVKVGWTRGENERERLTKRADALRVEGRREEEDRE